MGKDGNLACYTSLLFRLGLVYIGSCGRNGGLVGKRFDGSCNYC